MFGAERAVESAASGERQIIFGASEDLVVYCRTRSCGCPVGCPVLVQQAATVMADAPGKGIVKKETKD